MRPLNVVSCTTSTNVCLRLFCIAGYCYIELRSWGYEDTARKGYARVNGHTVVNYERPDRNEEVRGFNVNILRLSDCATTAQKHIDTWNQTAHGAADLALYLDSLTPGTVVYGATCDDAKYALWEVGINALLKIGINVSSLTVRGKLTFVAVIGRPLSTVFRIAKPGGDNLFMNALVKQMPTQTSGNLWNSY